MNFSYISFKTSALILSSVKTRRLHASKSRTHPYDNSRTLKTYQYFRNFLHPCCHVFVIQLVFHSFVTNVPGRIYCNTMCQIFLCLQYSSIGSTSHPPDDRSVGHQRKNDRLLSACSLAPFYIFSFEWIKLCSNLLSGVLHVRIERELVLYSYPQIFNLSFPRYWFAVDYYVLILQVLPFSSSDQ